MKLNQPRSKQLLFASAALLIVAILSVGVWQIRANQNNASTADNPSDNAQTTTDFAGPTESEREQVEENKTKDGGPTRPADPTPPPPSDKLAKISKASYDEASRKATIQTQLYGAGWQQCRLELTQGTEKITKTADALYQADFSTCLGFSVPASEFPAGGAWAATVYVTNSDGSTYTSNQENISVIK